MLICWESLTKTGFLRRKPLCSKQGALDRRPYKKQLQFLAFFWPNMTRLLDGEPELLCLSQGPRFVELTCNCCCGSCTSVEMFCTPPVHPNSPHLLFRRNTCDAAALNYTRPNNFLWFLEFWHVPQAWPPVNSSCWVKFCTMRLPSNLVTPSLEGLIFTSAGGDSVRDSPSSKNYEHRE